MIRGIKEKIENGEGIEKCTEVRNGWSRFLYIGVSFFPRFVELIVGCMYNLLLDTDVYCLFPCWRLVSDGPAMTRLVHDFTLSSRDVVDRSCRFWSFLALHMGGGSSENLDACPVRTIFDATCDFELKVCMFWLRHESSFWCNSFRCKDLYRFIFCYSILNGLYSGLSFCLENPSVYMGTTIHA